MNINRICIRCSYINRLITSTIYFRYISCSIPDWIVIFLSYKNITLAYLFTTVLYIMQLNIFKNIQPKNLFSHLYTVSHRYQRWQREPGNLVLRNSVSIKTFPFLTFLFVLESLHVEWRNSTTRFPSLLE